MQEGRREVKVKIKHWINGVARVSDSYRDVIGIVTTRENW